jgi:hypothetical protein
MGVFACDWIGRRTKFKFTETIFYKCFLKAAKTVSIPTPYHTWVPYQALNEYYDYRDRQRRTDREVLRAILHLKSQSTHSKSMSSDPGHPQEETITINALTPRL